MRAALLAALLLAGGAAHACGEFHFDDPAIGRQVSFLINSIWTRRAPHQ